MAKDEKAVETAEAVETTTTKEEKVETPKVEDKTVESAKESAPEADIVEETKAEKGVEDTKEETPKVEEKDVIKTTKAENDKQVETPKAEKPKEAPKVEEPEVPKVAETPKAIKKETPKQITLTPKTPLYRAPNRKFRIKGACGAAAVLGNEGEFTKIQYMRIGFGPQIGYVIIND